MSLKRVLIVEFDPSMRTLLQSYVKQFDPENIDSMSTEQVSIDLLQKTSFDLIILDWKAKKTSSTQLYQLIRQGPANQNTPMILTSGAVTRDDLALLSKTDPNSRFVVKPCTEEVLTQAISYLIQQKTKQNLPGDRDLMLFKGQGSKSGHGLSIHKNKPGSGPENFVDKGKKGEGFSHKDGSAADEFNFDADAEIPLNDLGFDHSKETDHISTRTDFPTQDPRKTPPAPQGVKGPGARRPNEEVGVPTAKAPIGKASGVPTAKAPIGKGSDAPSIHKSNIADKESQRPRIAEKPVVDDVVASLIQDKIQALQATIFSKEMKVLLVEDKVAVVEAVKFYLKKIADVDVEIVRDGKAAWSAIRNSSFQMIVMNWRMRAMKGLSIYNRLRSDPSTRHIPIIILCGQMNEKDFRILEESNCTRTVSSPLDFKVFEQAVKDVFQANIGVSKISSVAGMAVDQAREDNIDLFDALQSTSDKVPYRFEFFLAAGQYLSFLGEHENAEKVLGLASRINPENVSVITEVAKIHLRQKRPVEALALLTRANEFSPGNVERLCLMGEVGLDLFQTEDARDFFKKALEIDAEHQRAKDGVVVATNLEQFLKTQDRTDLLNDKLASTLNLVGIAYVRNEQISEGIQQYVSALAFIYDQPTIARVQFNLALAHLRNRARTEAFEWLAKAIKNADASFSKPKEILARLNGSLDWELLGEELDAADFEGGLWDWDLGKLRKSK